MKTLKHVISQISQEIQATTIQSYNVMNILSLFQMLH